MPYEPLPDLEGLSLTDIAELAASRKLPPVEKWNPEQESDSHMRIASDGRWFHDGSPINRPAMVRAFLSILRREDDGRYWLVTPHYKQSIVVEDVPFLAVEVEAKDEGADRQIAVRLNSDDVVIAGTDHPLRFENLDSKPAPYIMVRGGMEARLTRSAFYQMVELAEENADGKLGIRSGGQFFELSGNRV